MTVESPLVSIVTPSFNQAQFLEQTMQSVLQQSYRQVEYIVIDGGSTDGSVDIIRNFEDRLAYWESEPDEGPVHAINKGFAKATGDIYGWLNSDDYLLPGALEHAVGALADPEVDFVYGDSLHCDEQGRITDASMLTTMSPHHWLLYAIGALHQESAFWRSSVHEALGELDPGCFPGFDIDWFLRLTHHIGPRYRYLRVPLGVAREHPGQNIAGLREPGSNQAKETAMRPRRDFIHAHGVPSWKLALGGLVFGTWRRLHESYVRSLGVSRVLRPPSSATIRRLLAFRK